MDPKKVIPTKHWTGTRWIRTPPEPRHTPEEGEAVLRSFVDFDYSALEQAMVRHSTANILRRSRRG